MQRRELSFHDHVRLLGYLSALIADLPGDVVEIGVWKGKSLMLINEVCNRERRVIGIDPFALPNQFEEFSHYHELLLPNATVIRSFSELAAGRFDRVRRLRRLRTFARGRANRGSAAGERVLQGLQCAGAGAWVRGELCHSACVSAERAAASRPRSRACLALTTDTSPGNTTAFFSASTWAITLTAISAGVLLPI